MPYIILIAGFSASRGIPAITAPLSELAAIQPFVEGPVLLPLLHPATWLAAVGILAGMATGSIDAIRAAARRAWSDGRKVALTITICLLVAQLMADSKMAPALAEGLRLLLGQSAILMTPLLAGMLGFLTGSSNAANGLLMPSQVNLATNNTQLLWVAAIQNTAAAALTMLSPARIAMGCALVGTPDLERSLYAQVWPLGAVAIAALSFAAAMLLLLA
jgi:lactate permease